MSPTKRHQSPVHDCCCAMVGLIVGAMFAGASGGVAAAARVIAPQFIPISQLVLLTVKVQGELQARTSSD